MQAIARGEVKEDIDLDATARVIHTFMITISDSLLLPYLNNYLYVTDEEVGLKRTLGTLLDLVITGIGVEGRVDNAIEGNR